MYAKLRFTEGRHDPHGACDRHWMSCMRTYLYLSSSSPLICRTDSNFCSCMQAMALLDVRQADTKCGLVRLQGVTKTKHKSVMDILATTAFIVFFTFKSLAQCMSRLNR